MLACLNGHLSMTVAWFQLPSRAQLFNKVMKGELTMTLQEHEFQIGRDVLLGEADLLTTTEGE